MSTINLTCKRFSIYDEQNDVTMKVYKVLNNGEFFCYISKDTDLDHWDAFKTIDTEFICGGLTKKECLESVKRVIESERVNSETLTTLNIGLNVGDKEPKTQFLRTLDLIRPIDFKVVMGEYDGVKERTVVCTIPNDTSIDKIINTCILLQQDCIAVKPFNHKGFLVCHPNRDIDFSFDAQYFISL